MKNILIVIMIFISANMNAQLKFVTSGKIEYELKKNQHKQLDDEKEQGQEDSEWIKTLKVQMPKFVIDNYSLTFNEETSVYKLLNENADNKYLWGGKPSENDKLVTDVKSGNQSIQKDVYELTYLLKDSMRKLTWKIMDETREIAGYECKKAVTKICDSVYVVAFYCEQIPVSVGPESFGGLPGMILGLAVPRLATTWYATKVVITNPPLTELTPKLKGKVATWQGFEKDLKKALKDWGKYGNRQMWRYML